MQTKSTFTRTRETISLVTTTKGYLSCLLPFHFKLSSQASEAGLLPESQCGFCAGRGTADMIFAAQQLQEKCIEQNSDLYMTFVVLTKAFDAVSREGL